MSNQKPPPWLAIFISVPLIVLIFGSIFFQAYINSKIPNPTIQGIVTKVEFKAEDDSWVIYFKDGRITRYVHMTDRAPPVFYIGKKQEIISWKRSPHSILQVNLLSDDPELTMEPIRIKLDD